MAQLTRQHLTLYHVHQCTAHLNNDGQLAGLHRHLGDARLRPGTTAAVEAATGVEAAVELACSGGKEATSGVRMRVHNLAGHTRRQRCLLL